VISIIIPTLNEEKNLGGAVEAIRRNAVPYEIIIADGQSTDETRRIAAQLGVQVVICAKQQRAAQLNLGARQAKGEILLFLHADTRLPANALEQIRLALAHSAVGGGAFTRKFHSPSLFLKISCLLAEFRNRTVGWHLGDQAMFVRKALFDQLGGFRLMDRFEDLDFSRRLRAISAVVTLRPPVITSARRFEKEGPIVRTLHDLWLTVHYFISKKE
jgi:rSAM/selenodomain-associated transferase 2